MTFKLSDFATISSEVENPHFYIRRKGSLKSDLKPGKYTGAIGEVSKERPEASHKSSWFGIKLNETGLMYFDPNYLYYFMMNIYNQGVWDMFGHGSLRLVNLRKDDIDQVIRFSPAQEIPKETVDLDKKSSIRASRILKIKKIAALLN